MQLQSSHSSRLRRVAAWTAACLLALVATNAAARDACEANFFQRGDTASGISFGTSRTVPGLTPHDALAQYRRMALEQGFKVGDDSYRHGRGELVLSQLPSFNARGFDIHVVADATGKVAVSATLPRGASVEPGAARTSLCRDLGRLRVGAGQGQAQTPVVALTPGQRSQICLANFVNLGSRTEGEALSTWAPGVNMDLSRALTRLKATVAAGKVAHVVAEASHGHKATLAVALDNVAAVSDGGYRVGGPDQRGFLLRFDLDASLSAVSFSAHLNPEQDGIDYERTRRMACTFIASAIDGAPIPEEKRKSRFHLRNPFKNPRKEAKEQQDAEVALMRQALVLLYQRAARAGKAMVFMPMANLGRKYQAAGGLDLVAGSEVYPAWRFDQTTNMVWRADAGDIVRVGSQNSLFGEGLFGYVQKVSADKTEYGLYILDPGSYGLAGVTYLLPHSSLPALSGVHWSEKPGLGVASMAVTRDAEFSQSAVWADAQYQHVSVADGSYCAMHVTSGSVSGCAQWQTTYHDETREVRPAGWQTHVEKDYAGGLAVSVKLARPFARFDVGAGEVVVTDGFIALPDGMAIDEKACRQAGDNQVDCAIDSLRLFRISGRKDDLRLPAEVISTHPMLADLVARVQYRPVKVDAPKVPQAPGTYLADWTEAYRLSVH